MQFLLLLIPIFLAMSPREASSSSSSGSSSISAHWLSKVVTHAYKFEQLQDSFFPLCFQASKDTVVSLITDVRQCCQLSYLSSLE